MNYWRGGFVVDLLLVVSLLAVAALLRRAVPRLRRFGLPDAIVAGSLGLVVGPTCLGWLEVDAENLETVVYHGVALIFIAVSLQSPPHGTRTRGAASCAFAIAVFAALQGLVGLGVVLAWNATAEVPIHTGIGMVLPLGFNQGPGSAMTLGAAWEQNAGMRDGAQIGLIMAAIGFAWCCVAGVALVAYGRHRGWTGPADPPLTGSRRELEVERATRSRPTFGSMDPLVTQIVAIAVVYLATYGFLAAVAPLLPERHQPTLWSLHFVFASIVALLARRLLTRLPGGSPLHDELLARSSSVFVEVTTACALVAVQLTVLSEWIGPILAISTVGGLVTVAVTLWIARRAFPDAPFEHAVVLFGAMTGTTATGLSLLRLVDPEFRSPAAHNFVIAAGAATVLAAPLLALMPYPVLGFEHDYLRSLSITLALLAAYTLALVIAWRRFASLRFARPLLTLWPQVDHDAPR